MDKDIKVEQEPSVLENEDTEETEQIIQNGTEDSTPEEEEIEEGSLIKAGSNDVG